MQIVKRVIESFPMNAQIALSGSVLTFNLHNDGNSQFTKTVDLAAAIASHAQDHGCIAIGESDSGILIVETTAISVSRRMTPGIDSQNTSRGDSPLAIYRSQGGGSYPAVFVFTPFKGCQLADCTLYFMESGGQTTYESTDVSGTLTVGNVSITVDGHPLQAQDVGTVAQYFSSWLPVSLDGANSVTSGQDASFIVSAGENAEVFLEATAGVINRARAKNGDTVILSAVGVPAGESIRIKAGYKFWPGKSDKTIAVV